MASYRQWYVHFPNALFFPALGHVCAPVTSLVCTPTDCSNARNRSLHVPRLSLHSRVPASNRLNPHFAPATQLRAVPGIWPTCSLRHVVVFSTLVVVPAASNAKECKHNPKCRFRC